MGKTLCEVGVGPVGQSRALTHPAVLEYDQVILVEANPAFVEEITDAIRRTYSAEAQKKFKVIHAAIWDTPRIVTINYRPGHRDLSAFVSDLSSSPLIAHYARHNMTPEFASFEVPAVTFDVIDPCDISTLFIDVEGAEWFVLKYLCSRPAEIRLETHYAPTNYLNPHMELITKWLALNNYQLQAQDASDSIYVRGN